MGKTYFNILLFLVFFISLCNSYDYKYDDYNNNKYDENYKYYDHYHWDYYTDDNSQELNDDYGHQNLLAPAAFPISPPLTPPPAPTPKPVLFLTCVNEWCRQAGTNDQYTKCGSASSDGKTCHNPEIRYGSAVGGRPVKVNHLSDAQRSAELLLWCKQIFPNTKKGTAVYSSDPSLNSVTGAVWWCSYGDENNPHWCKWFHTEGILWKDATNPFIHNLTCGGSNNPHGCIMTSVTCE